MKKEIKTEITIQASVEAVWSVLTEFNTYPEWNPFIIEIKGNIEEGSKLRVNLKPPGGKSMVFKPKLISVQKNVKLSWLGHLFVPGIFDGEHIFELEQTKDGNCRFIQREKFAGILLPLLKKMLDNETIDGFNEMNRALKMRVENLWKTSLQSSQLPSG